MNQEKAREFFSAYYEGNLESGLRQAFEQRLMADATLQADYAAFVETMESLGTLKHEEIEIPIYLSDRIATRIEEAQSRRQVRVPAWSNWFRNLAFGGLAAAALFGGLVAVLNKGEGVSTASVVPSGPTAETASVDQLMFAATPNGVEIQFKASANSSVIVSSATNGRVLKRFDLKGNALQSVLTNDLEGTAVFRVLVEGATDDAEVAIPGRNPVVPNAGSGTIREFAAALASFYRVPVVVRVDEDAKPVTWDFQGTDAGDVAAQLLASYGYSVDQRESGLITILDR